MTREVAVWLPQGQRSPSGIAELVGAARAQGGARALDRWLAEHPEGRAAYVHGERHSLWWEFSLADSFRWQGHICRMRPAAARQRTLKLAARFGLTALLARSVEELAPAERAAADLAVALLPAPELLVWEEPRLQLAHLVREFCHTEGTAVVAVATNGCALRSLSLPARQTGRLAQ